MAPSYDWVVSSASAQYEGFEVMMTEIAPTGWKRHNLRQMKGWLGAPEAYLTA